MQTLEGSNDGLLKWVPTTHQEDLGNVLESWLWPKPAPGRFGYVESRALGGSILIFSLSLSLSPYQINKNMGAGVLQQ